MKERQLGRKFGNGEVVMSSLDIAELTGKRHADVMRDIRVEVLNLGQKLGQRIFAQSYYRFSERESPLRCDSTPFRGGRSQLH